VEGVELTTGNALSPGLGIAIMVGLGLVLLTQAYYAKVKLVRSTHDFLIAGRKLGFGFSVANLLSGWTWVVGILMPIAVVYSFGLSGLWWFTVPNGVAVIAVVPFAKKLKSLMPHGYTISEFTSVRYGGAKLAHAVVVAAILFGAVTAVIVNLKGAAVVMSAVFGINQGTVALVAAVIILSYIVLGGLWANVANAVVLSFTITVLPAIIVFTTVGHVGGAEPIWQEVASRGNDLLSVTRADAFENFGITFALALITATIAGQEFWSVAWALRDNELGRAFFWGGALYYPIALCLGVLGLVAIAMNVDLVTHLGNDPAAVGPFLISHLGLPNWIVVIFVLAVLSACYSVSDGALAAVSSITAVDIIKPLYPDISDEKLLFWTRASMVITGVIAVAVVLSGVDFVTLLLGTAAIRGAVLVPLILSIVWSKMNARAFTWGTIAAVAIGIPCRFLFGELVSTTTIVLVSTVVPLVIGFLNQERFDYSILAKVEDI
jgi:Na+/proline symporter